MGCFLCCVKNTLRLLVSFQDIEKDMTCESLAKLVLAFELAHVQEDALAIEEIRLLSLNEDSDLELDIQEELAIRKAETKTATRGNKSVPKNLAPLSKQEEGSYAGFGFGRSSKAELNEEEKPFSMNATAVTSASTTEE